MPPVHGHGCVVKKSGLQPLVFEFPPIERHRRQMFPVNPRTTNGSWVDLVNGECEKLVVSMYTRMCMRACAQV